MCSNCCFCSHDLCEVGADKDSSCQSSVGSAPHAEPVTDLVESLVPDTGLPQPQRETGTVSDYRDRDGEGDAIIETMCWIKF